MNLGRDPAADQATVRAVHDAAQAGKHAAAAALAEAALAGGLEHALLLNVVALRLEEQGKLPEAERLLRRAVEIAPDDQGARNALGLVLLQLERPAQALPQFEALLQLNPSLPFAHANRGSALIELGLIAQAQASYRRALDLDPRQAMALTGLARLAAGRGAHSEARGWAQKALAVLPGFPDAVLSLASAELGEQNLADAEARLRALLDDVRLGPKERAYANGLLADVLDAKDYTDEAFAAYSLCNQQLQRMHAARFSSSGGALTYARSMHDYLARTAPEIWKQRPSADPRCTGASRHVFVLGFPQSGATLLEVVLKGHPDVVSLQQSESLIAAVQEYMQRPEDLGRFASAPEQTLGRLREAYWQRVAAAGVDVKGKLFVDEHPLNTLKLPLIARLFPEARIVFACRDPRDVVLSCFRHRFRMSAPMYELLSLEGAARYYDAVMQLAVRLTGTLALEMCLVRHEDVVTAFAREMKRVCDFLDIQWHPAMGDFALRPKDPTAPAITTAQLVRGLGTEGIGQWRRYRRHMAGVLPVLEPWIKRFYYEES